MLLFIYVMISWFTYFFIREILFTKNTSLPIIQELEEQGLTPEGLDFRLFILSLFWPILMLYILFKL
jgi:hypothetical protein